MPQYSTRASFPRRGNFTNAHRQYILERDGGICFYCEFEANSVDHIVPYSYGGSDEDSNLIACCSICNSIANNKIFDTIEEKREYVRGRYGPYLEKRWRRVLRQLSICADCHNVYNPQEIGATVVLCVACYKADDEGHYGSLREACGVYDVERRANPIAAILDNAYYV